MDLLQAWMIVGVPTLAVALGLFAGRSRVRAAVGYLLLVGLVVLFAVTPGGGLFAAAVGLLLVVLVASGRGTDIDTDYHEHHEHRRRLTTAAGS